MRSREILNSDLKADRVFAVEMGPEWIQWRMGWDMDLRPWTKLALESAT